MTMNSIKIDSSNIMDQSTKIKYSDQDYTIDGYETITNRDEGISSFKIFMMLIKGYCAMVILILPKSFENGGYIASPLTLIMSAVVSCICALKLAKVGIKTNIYDYSQVG